MRGSSAKNWAGQIRTVRDHVGGIGPSRESLVEVKILPHAQPELLIGRGYGSVP